MLSVYSIHLPSFIRYNIVSASSSVFNSTNTPSYVFSVGVWVNVGPFKISYCGSVNVNTSDSFPRYKALAYKGLLAPSSILPT